MQKRKPGQSHKGWKAAARYSCAPEPDSEAVIEYLFRGLDGDYWIDVRANGQPFHSVGPFDTETEWQRLWMTRWP